MEQWLNAWWEGLVLAAAAWAVARPRLLDAGGRYRVWCAALGGLALLLAAAALGVRQPGVPPPWGQPAAGLSGAAASSLPHANPFIAVPALELPLALLLGAWASVALLKIAWLAVAICRIRAARAAASPFPPARLRRLAEWRAASGGRVALALSHRIASACMLGFGRPLVVVPAAWLDRFSDEEIDAVLMHELAHAERRDDLQHLVQELLVAACWFHPAAWWMARRIEFEREATCDDRAARHITTRRYASCLVSVAEAMRGSRRPTPHLAASSAGRPRLLTRRIERLVRGGALRLAGARSVASLVTLAVAVAAIIAGGVVPPVFGVGDPAPRSTAAASEPGGRMAAVAEASEPGSPARSAQEGNRAPGGRFAALRAPVGQGPRAGAAAAVPADVQPAPAPASLGSPDPSAPVPPTTEAESASTPSLSSREWESNGAFDRAPTIAADSGAMARAGGNAASPPGSPFRGLGAALSQVGKRTGQWFSRGGASIAHAVTSR